MKNLRSSKKLLAILSIATLLSSCGNFKKPFPTDELYAAPIPQFCIKYKIINFNPIKVGEGEIIKDPEKCPKMVMGFKYQDIPAIQAWLLELQTGKKTSKMDLEFRQKSWESLERDFSELLKEKTE